MRQTMPCSPQRLDSDCFPAPSRQSRPQVEGLRAGDRGSGEGLLGHSALGTDEAGGPRGGGA